jgi:hypothetical protein
MDWFNNRGLLQPPGYIPPAEAVAKAFELDDQAAVAPDRPNTAASEKAGKPRPDVVFRLRGESPELPDNLVANRLQASSTDPAIVDGQTLGGGVRPRVVRPCRARRGSKAGTRSPTGRLDGWRVRSGPSVHRPTSCSAQPV